MSIEKAMLEIPPRESTQEDCKEGNETYNYHFILLPLNKSYFLPQREASIRCYTCIHLIHGACGKGHQVYTQL